MLAAFGFLSVVGFHHQFMTLHLPQKALRNDYNRVAYEAVESDSPQPVYQPIRENPFTILLGGSILSQVERQYFAEKRFKDYLIVPQVDRPFVRTLIGMLGWLLPGLLIFGRTGSKT